MFIKRSILRTAGTTVAATICLAVQALAAQTSSESKAIEELKRQVAELQKEVASLKQHGGPAPAAIVEGNAGSSVAVFTVTVSSVVPGPQTVTATYTITGGTGRFDGATGSFTLNGFYSLSTHVFTANSKGTIAYKKKN